MPKPSVSERLYGLLLRLYPAECRKISATKCCESSPTLLLNLRRTAEPPGHLDAYNRKIAFGYANPDRVVFVSEELTDGSAPGILASFVNAADWNESNSTFVALARQRPGALALTGISVMIQFGAEAERPFSPRPSPHWPRPDGHDRP